MSAEFLETPALSGALAASRWRLARAGYGPESSDVSAVYLRVRRPIASVRSVRGSPGSAKQGENATLPQGAEPTLGQPRQMSEAALSSCFPCIP